eukprot:TRINITY_DN865_c0_g1_i1.p1 TRINITY_DN865_c0_g1~~TRINITY_DN865_c0_g1_i1.p1  ORF type:complete len:303 (+),score=67.47 TRINITY_DN865_c0_g1_i1:174-1082(+)
MPVTGLPVTLEKTLTALLTDNTVSSWKIAGESDNTVVVLRLRPATQVSTTTMADPVLNRRTQVEYFRKKAPSQVRRDQQRARQQQQRRQEQVDVLCDSSNNDVKELSASDTQFCDESTQELAAEHITPVHTEHSDSDTDEGGRDVSEDLPACVSDSNFSLSLQPDLNIEHAMIEHSVAGFNTRGVKNYVATLTDRSVQRRLRDKQRNTSFRKAVLHRCEDVNRLLFESDDIVLEYPCDSRSEEDWSYWFVKQEEKNMLQEERVKLANLRKGKRINNTVHAETQARALRGLHALHDLICFYLG